MMRNAPPRIEPLISAHPRCCDDQRPRFADKRRSARISGLKLESRGGIAPAFAALQAAA